MGEYGWCGDGEQMLAGRRPLCGWEQREGVSSSRYSERGKALRKSIKTPTRHATTTLLLYCIYS